MDENQQLIYMQTRLVRLASEKWKMSMEEAAKIFEKYNVFQYIEDCFGIFHAEGDAAVFEDVMIYIRNKGAVINEETD